MTTKGKREDKGEGKREDKGEGNRRSLRDDNKRQPQPKTTAEAPAEQRRRQNNGGGGLAAIGGDGCLLHEFEGHVVFCGGGAAVFELGCGVEDFAVA